MRASITAGWIAWSGFDFGRLSNGGEECSGRASAPLDAGECLSANYGVLHAEAGCRGGGGEGFVRDERASGVGVYATSFNEDHIAAITQAICEYRKNEGTTGPLFLAQDTHALSEPAFATALEVLAGNGIETMVDTELAYTPTPALCLMQF